MEERESGECFGQEGCRGVCCVNLMKNGGLYIGKGGGVKVRPYGWVWVGNWF